MNYLDQLEKKGKVFVIRPQVKPVSRLERNTETLHAFYEHGYKLMDRKLDALMEIWRNRKGEGETAVSRPENLDYTQNKHAI